MPEVAGLHAVAERRADRAALDTIALLAQVAWGVGCRAHALVVLAELVRLEVGRLRELLPAALDIARKWHANTHVLLRDAHTSTCLECDLHMPTENRMSAPRKSPQASPSAATERRRTEAQALFAVRTWSPLNCQLTH